jgi:hypothetical protein
MRPRPAPVTWGVLALLLALGLSGCGGGGGSADKSVAADAGSAALSDGARGPGARAGKAEPAAAVSRRAVISTGTVDLATREVAEIRARVSSVLEAHDGVLADERTTTDEKGRTAYARLVLRVPAEDFAAVMDQLAGLGRLVDSSRKSEDVTTEVIDVDQRVEVQRAGLQRTVALLDRANTLADILKIEDEITRRRADLDSLVGQQRYLRSQTSLSTITVTVDRTLPAPVAHTGGFVGGLRSGWDGLTAFLGWVVTAVGTLLPFTLLLVVLAPLAWVVRRALRGRGGVPEPAQPTS